MLNYFLVGLGSALGGILRFWLSGVVANRFGQSFPWGTILVNITGCLVIGFFNTLTSTDGRFMMSPASRTFFMIGICGGYTTFSSFSLQTLNLMEEGEWWRAGGNVVISVVFCLVGVWLGHLLAAQFNSLKGH
ncbi:MAG TPA: fluoride efflux transporter CrcB [Verrucomicrobiae bacterium]